MDDQTVISQMLPQAEGEFQQTGESGELNSNDVGIHDSKEEIEQRQGAEWISLLEATSALGNPQLQDLLTSNPVDLNAPAEGSLETPLHLVVHASLCHPAASVVKAIQLLAFHGADLDRHDSGGMTPLQICAKGGTDYLATAKALIELGADVNASKRPERDSGDGCTCGGQVGTMLSALTGGEFKPGAGEEDMTALHYAAKEGHLEMVNLLLENGARVDALNKDGGTWFSTWSTHAR